MSSKLFRPKIVTIAASILVTAIYFGHSEDRKIPELTKVETSSIAQESQTSTHPTQGESENEIGRNSVSNGDVNRSPAFSSNLEVADTVESSPDFFQSGKLELNLRYVLEKDPVFLEQNSRLFDLIRSGQKVRAEDINIPNGFRVSLRIEPNCKSSAEDIFQMEAPDENARSLLASGNPAFVAAKTKLNLSGSDLTKALQAESCITAAGADLLEEAGSVAIQDEPLTSSAQTKAYQIMKNAGLVSLFSMISFSTFNAATVTFGVVDTGVNVSHPDLSEIATGGRDDYGHGTMVAGTAAAPANRIGTMGSMPFHVKIRSFKINEPGKGSAYGSNISNGILRAAYENIDVINVSWSGFSTGSYNNAVALAVKRGSVVTGSGGNSSLKISTNVTIPGSIAVGALNGTNNNVASYSNYGPGIEVFTPGTYMTTMKSGTYALVSGTSFAAPLVGGIALMIKAYAKARGQQASPATIEKMIMSSTDLISTNRGYLRKLDPSAVFQRLQTTFF